MGQRLFASAMVANPDPSATADGTDDPAAGSLIAKLDNLATRGIVSLGMKQTLKGEILKGHLELLILSAVRHRPLHGYAIVEAIRADSRGTFDLPEGTLYPALHRLEESGVLKS